MTARILHCQACGRRCDAPPAPDWADLRCFACGGPLGPEPVEAEAADEPFRRRHIADAALKKLDSVCPGRYVYRADDRTLRTQVRMEIFPQGETIDDDEPLRRIFRAAAATRELRSMHVVTLLDLGRVEDCWFIKSQHLPDTLRSVMERKGTLDLRAALRIADGALAGLVDLAGALGPDAAHGAVDPDHVLLGHDGEAVLDHLGTGAYDALPGAPGPDALTVTPGGSLAGPALYAAPELRADPAAPRDVRSDLYALGASLFEALVGRPPAAGEGVADAAPELPAELARFIARLTAPEPDRRPPTAQAAREELRDVVACLRERDDLAERPGAGDSAATVRWNATWSVVAVVLIVLTIVPFVLLGRMRGRRQAVRRAVERRGPAAVAVAVQPADPRLGGELPEAEERAVRAVVRHYMQYYPGLVSALRAVDETLTGRLSAELWLDRAGAPNVVIAAHSPGMGRRNWRVDFVRRADEQWAERADCAVADDARDLGDLEQAVIDALARGAARLGKGPASEPVAAGASVRAWAELGLAYEAELEGRWVDALDHAKVAAWEAPEAPGFGVLVGYYEAVNAALADGQFPPAPAARDHAPPALLALADLLGALHEGTPEAVEPAVAAYVRAAPLSTRGYLLLSVWRETVMGRPQEAVSSYAQVFSMDYRNTGAARAALRLLAAGSPRSVGQFMDMARRRGLAPRELDRLQAYADSLLGTAPAAPKPPGAGQ